MTLAEYEAERTCIAARRRKEEQARTWELSRLKHAHRPRFGFPDERPPALDDRIAWFALRERLAGRDLDARAPAMRAWFAGICRADGAQYEPAVLAGVTHGYARISRKSFEAPRIDDLVTLAIGLHEESHVVLGCARDHRPQVYGPPFFTACIQCETSAWTRAVDLLTASPFGFTRSAHAFVIKCLTSYRQYATLPAEHAAIDRMCSNVFYCQVRCTLAAKQRR